MKDAVDLGHYRLDLTSLRITPPKTSMTREEATSWYQALVEQKQQVEGHLAKRTAEAKVFQQECFARGAAGKKEWFSFDAEESVWRAKARGFLNVVEKHMRQAKVLMRQPRQAAPEKVEKKRRNRAIADVVDAAELLVDSSGSDVAMNRLREAVAALRVLRAEEKLGLDP